MELFTGQRAKFYIDTGVDLNTLGATVTNLKVLRPGEDAEVTWTGSIHTDGTSIYYNATESDLLPVGTYSLQAYVDDGVDGPWRGTQYCFKVKDVHTG